MDASCGEEPQRVKFLCSFGGSILPRPVDGKLRYVGGETRIVSLPRDVAFDDLMARLRELFDGAWAIKYQQPEEDLDALVSVVNDDDVMNMMEEYDKLGDGKDGFTRLRIFLFPHPEHDGSGSMSSPRFDADERETERRYVDALNSLPDGKNQNQLLDDPVADGNRGEPLFGSMAGLDVLHSHQFSNLHQLKIPRVPSYQRYADLDGSWSPAACYSPGQHTPREYREFSPSPSSGRFHVGMDGLNDRITDEYVRHSPAHMYEHQQSPSPFVDNGNVVWYPPGGVVGEHAGFPGNLGHTHSSAYEGGSNICEHCHMAFQGNHTMVAEMRYHPHVDQLGSGVEFSGHFLDSCIECLRERDFFLSNQERKLDHGVYVHEQIEHRSFYTDPHVHDRDRVLRHNQASHRPPEVRGHRNVQYVLDGNGFPCSLGNSYNGHQDDPHYICPTTGLGNEVYHEQHVVGGGPRLHVSPLEDGGIRYGNNASVYGTDGLHQVPHGSPAHSLRRTHGPVLGPPYDASVFLPQANGALNVGYNRVTQDGSPRFAHVGQDNQYHNPWIGQTAAAPPKVSPINGIAASKYQHGIAPKLNPDILIKDDRYCVTQDSANYQPAGVVVHGETSSSYTVDGKTVASASSVSHVLPNCISDLNAADKAEESNLIEESSKKVTAMECCGSNIISPMEELNATSDSRRLNFTEEKNEFLIIAESNMPGPNEVKEIPNDHSLCLPEVIDPVKKAVLEGAEEMKIRFKISDDVSAPHQSKEETSPHGLISTKDLEVDLDDEQPVISNIEPTTAEQEALAKGLQTIKNNDLEEMRELGTGTYGAVYHGKWRGSDVAIKRIKSSCFSGRPSERERLIADFWKEASILSSLHHPNVVSFYGVVRDGPDGSLATVTEFMVNGSLKQFLQKKDRTIDRRKRLILAMDAAFGMEYLHEKNIVHFDLKCENLLVNMRDPHRPVCKIGDLGLSKVKQRTLVSGGVRGTLPWMAPELLSGKTNMVTEKIDVYSFGIVMWELLTAEEPYTGMNCASIIGGILNNTLRPQIPTWCDPEWKSLMESCWASDPGERPSFSDISQKLRKMSAAINIK